jgi:hypothetical protein
VELGKQQRQGQRKQQRPWASAHEAWAMAGEEKQNPFHHNSDQCLDYNRAVNTRGFIALGGIFSQLAWANVVI